MTPMPPRPAMTGEQVRAARATLGLMWGVGRPLSLTELARACRSASARPNETAVKWERNGPPGPISLVIQLYLDGAEPPDGLDYILGR